MLNFTEYGAKNPKIFLLLHNGQEENLKDWNDMIVKLSKQYHVIAPDLPARNLNHDEAVSYAKKVYDIIKHKDIECLCSLRENWALTNILIDDYNIQPTHSLLEMQRSTPNSLLSEILQCS